MFRPVLIVCRLPDPHVEAVIAHLRPESVRITDLNAPSQSERLAWSTLPESGVPYESVWWRYKASAAAYRGEALSQDAFIEREWLQLLRSLPGTSGDCLWVNNPVTHFLAGLKLRNLQLARRCGFRVPATLASNCPDQIRTFMKMAGATEYIYKPLSYYYEAPDVAVFASLVTPARVDECFDQIALAPVLIQERIPKQYELRVTVVRERVFAARIDSQAVPGAEVDWRRSQTSRSMYSPTELPPAAQSALLDLHTKLELTYGAYDFIVTPDSDLVFLEVNPGGQWMWIENFTGLPISRALARLLAHGGAG